jgi:hypothetical protein
MISCEFCNKNYKNEYTLKIHQKTTKKCLNIQLTISSNFVSKNNKFICKGCDKNFSSKQSLNNHCTKHCTMIIEYTMNEKHTEILNKNKEKYESLLDDKNNEILKIITEKDNKILEIKNLNKKVTKLENRIDEITDMAIQRPFENEIYIDIDPVDKENKDSECEIEEYKLSSLDIGEGYNIEHRDEDGYINVTNLCNAGGKHFKEWKRLEKTEAFIQALSSSVLISTNDLIRYNTGSNKERATWVHPHVAINIAQWISPLFDVKVSAWVYEAMMTGKVDISNTKTYKEIHMENKTKDIRIRFLEKKYLKRRPRVEYKEKYVIYILTTRLMQKERRYIMGKATDLTKRLSTYNKSDEHRVVYHKGCGNEETMSLVENAVFHHLQKYREQANRERFILPEKEEISLFSSCIKKSVEYFKKSDS